MKTIYIASPHFPPSSMPPSQRIRLFVKHLQSFNWHPVVFTVDQRYREEIADPWMNEITGHDFDEIKVKCFSHKLTRKIGIGDLGIRIFYGLRSELLRQIKIKKPDLVLYPVPPWYIMVMAPGIQKITGVPYAIDYIDPWVHKISSKGPKAKVSQWLARKLEGRVVRKSSIIFAVSQGILDDLVIRFPDIKDKLMVALPYGVEVSDYDYISQNLLPKKSKSKIIRYVGAISPAMLEVVNVLLEALVKINKNIPLQVEFIGTNYAAGPYSRPVLTEIIDRHKANDFIKESPGRVTYRKALELNAEASLQLLIGDITPYYAASKLMGLAASGLPFFAFVHKDSFPDNFLTEVGFQNKYTFDLESLNSQNTLDSLTTQLQNAIIHSEDFKRIPPTHTVLIKNTAKAMTKKLVDTINKINS